MRLLLVARRAAGRARPALRLLRLHADSRRVPAALASVAACAIGLRIALIAHWDSYGALQLPLVFEAASAAAIAIATASPLGEPERVNRPLAALPAAGHRAGADCHGGRSCWPPRAPGRTWPAASWTWRATWPG